jgi:hypothetical protein
MHSEALKFTELYVQILKEGFEAIAALGSSLKAKHMSDRLNKHRITLTLLIISAWDIDLQSVILNGWLGFLNWNDLTNVDQAVNEALMDSTPQPGWS